MALPRISFMDGEAGAPLSRKERVASFAAFAAAGVLALQGCQSQAGQVPPVIGVKEYMRQLPMGLRQENNEPGSYELGGKISSCRGQAECTLEALPGDILMNLRLPGESETNMEISVSSIGGGSIVLQRRMDGIGMDSAYDSQSVFVGQSFPLFNTDLSVSAVKGENGRYFITIR